MTKLSCRIPFAGFYHSIWDQSIDADVEQRIESYACKYERDRLEADLPGVAKLAPYLSDDDIRNAASDLIFDAADYSAAYAYLAPLYVETFADWLGDTLDAEVAVDFEEMTSPRFYNFETDRLFAKVPEDILQRIFDTLQAEDALAETFAELFTSRDGFSSFYDSGVPDKPLADWDHNELYALLVAWVSFNDIADIDYHLYDYGIGGLYEDVYAAVDAAVDWDKLAELSETWAADKADELGISDEDLPELPYRCPMTAELPLDGGGRA